MHPTTTLLLGLAAAAATVTANVCPGGANFSIRDGKDFDFQIKCGVDLNNEQDRWAVRVRTLFECAVECENDSGCQAATFQPSWMAGNWDNCFGKSAPLHTEVPSGSDIEAVIKQSAAKDVMVAREFAG